MSRAWYVDPHPEGISVHLDPIGDDVDHGEDIFLAVDMHSKGDAERLAKMLNERSEMLQLLKENGHLEGDEMCWCSLPVMIPYRGHDGTCEETRAIIAKAEGR